MLLAHLLLFSPALPGDHHVYTFRGAAGERTGAALAAAGDVDGDGRPDLIVGEPGAAPNGTRSGRARVFSGRDGRVLLVLDGASPFDALGSAVAAAGDVDGDGRADLLVGAPAGTPAAGRVELRSGADGSLLGTWTGELAGDRFGETVVGLGDVDGDGVPDVAVGAPNASGGGTRSGTVYLFSGADGRELARRSGAAWDFFGTSLAALPDLNGDGAAELLVGAPFDDRGAFNAGAATVLSGRDAGVLFEVLGAGIGDQLGERVAAAGDVDGDGAPDFLVGLPGDDGGGLDAGAVEVRSGKDGALVLRVVGSRPAEGLFVCAGAGDVNADGRADFLVGAPSADGASGAQAGRVLLISGADGGSLESFEGDARRDWFGAALAPLGDADGDGAPDFAAGAPVHDDEQEAGYARVLSLSARALTTDVHRLSLGAGGAQSLFLAGPPASAGRVYLLLGTAGGTRPGLWVQGLHLPLEPDGAYFPHTLANPARAPLLGSTGTLDGAARARASFLLPPGVLPLLAGLVLHHAFLVFDGAGGVAFTSNAASLLLQP